MTEPRTPCAVVGCRRSRKGSWLWWICADHKRTIPMRVRAQHKKAKAMCKRRGWIGSDDIGWWCTTPRARRVMDRAGRLMIRAANEAARGL